MAICLAQIDMVSQFLVVQLRGVSVDRALILRYRMAHLRVKIDILPSTFTLVNSVVGNLLCEGFNWHLRKVH